MLNVLMPAVGIAVTVAFFCPWRHVIALVAFVVMTWLAWLRRHHPLAAVFLLRGLLGGRR